MSNQTDAFYKYLTQAHNAATAEEQAAVLSAAQAELSEDEYEALVRVLRDTGLLFE